MDHIDIKAVANVSLKDLAEAIAELESYQISDFFLMVVEKQDNPLIAKNYADQLMQHYNAYLKGA